MRQTVANVFVFMLIVLFGRDAFGEDAIHHVASSQRDDNGLQMAFIWCPPGEFRMGSPIGETGRSTNEEQVSVRFTRGFWIGKYEVMHRQWEELMGTTPWFRESGVFIGNHCAANWVSRDDAIEFCEKFTAQERKAGRLLAPLVYRLPTEAEWEYACRGNTITAYSFGDSITRLNDHAWFAENARLVNEDFAHVVGQKLPNGFGLHDMHGNVAEWCWDWYAEKMPGGDDPSGETFGNMAVFRGGTFNSKPHECRSAFRQGSWPGNARLSVVGFRIVCGTSLNDAKKRLVDPPPVPKLDKPRPREFGPHTEASMPVTLDGKRAGQIRDDNCLNMKLVWCPAGTYLMGSPMTDMTRTSYEAQVEVTLTHGFWIGQFEVTQIEWERLMGTRPFSGSHSARIGRDYPASRISWEDASDFCSRLTDYETAAVALPRECAYRLPTEAEWEYACRAGTTTRYYFGDDEFALREYAWYDSNAHKAKEYYPHKVGMKTPNLWSLYDMNGNVKEWCLDCFDADNRGGVNPYVVRATRSRSVRGGDWRSAEKLLRSAHRDSMVLDSRSVGYGFRVVLARKLTTGNGNLSGERGKP